jgi:putative oxidoreductase
MANIGLLVLRLCLGTMFMAHGMQKVFGLFGGPGIKGVAQFLTSLGFAPATLWAYVLGCTELVGGILVILGLFTRGAAALLFIVMAIAVITVHLSKGFFMDNGGFEYPFIIAGVCAALVLMGSGKYALMK